MTLSPLPVHITGLAAASALGGTVDTQLTAMHQGRSGLRPLSDYPAEEELGYPDLLAGWLIDRPSWLKGRRYGAASNAAVRAARLAVEDAGWSASDQRDCWVFGASSRANLGELLGAWSSRRPISKFRASNSMHSEIAAAVSIELGIQGPWQVLANGCAAGLDAIGMAWLALRSGATRRALVVSVELPICRALMDGFAASGLLAGERSVNDPFHPDTSGFFPGEAVAALAMEATGTSRGCQILWYGANSDAYHSIALPPEGAGMARLLQHTMHQIQMANLSIAAFSPHANGTASNRVAETAAIQTAFGTQALRLHLSKPFTGHPLGASGAIETALLAGAMRRGVLPANLPGLTAPDATRTCPSGESSLKNGDVVLKSAQGMGGHNAVLAIQFHKET